ncbi:tetratricopeptide repeat protein [Mesonia maritima]|uniref:Tetratricopeptide (TPR) repeat protein n=1 Tax=Mesonia maritima TaxID=1793873 RepID=A0ABU1KCE4_9FLAO|nr:tetratricopeptide repeat protein [Mesonia maritima]MDR6302132.1 tetratricopeptide (TPR) repeat protein [Mesonia maritima]
MKKTILAISLSLVGVVAFAQKREIRDAEDAMEDGNYQEAKKILSSVEGQVASEKDRIKADYYLAKGKAYFGPLNAIPTVENLEQAGEAYRKAIEFGEEDEGKKGLTEVRNKLINTAINDQKQSKFDVAADKLYAAYQINTQDTLYLFYAASSAVNGKNYPKALKLYTQLDDLGYTGQGYKYTAVNKSTGEVERFDSESERDLFIKSGDYIKPDKVKTDSKRAEIIKNIALIHLQNDEPEKALEAIKEVRQENPEDVSLMLVESDVYLKMGETEEYSKVIEKIIEKDPTNPTLFYNLGVTSAQSGKKDKAIKYYKKAIELDPKMTNAYINLSTLILEDERKIVDEMNSLGMSKADNKRYDELVEEKKELYREAVPYLKKGMENDPSNTETIRTLMNIYSQLGEEQKAKELKQKLAE